jgi:hypothetical protein
VRFPSSERMNAFESRRRAEFSDLLRAGDSLRQAIQRRLTVVM